MRSAALPPEVRTIAVPAFVNRTQTYKIEQLLTQAVVREFGTRTTYHIVTQEDAGADATLRGEVTNVYLGPVTYDSQTGRASTGIVIVNIQVHLVDRQGKTLFENLNYVFRDQYQISRELSSFFAEEGPATDRLTGDFARTLVSNILEAW